ncbi:hypothetical protein B0I37DRAFT_40164 [Chaetomium sp. MPI-CAGE-AT-0009]|nr:hypothetical protein B0I37DRAFT_40164 [Chaetomium sp. MPI-CAGE-AT-0009]
MARRPRPIFPTLQSNPFLFLSPDPGGPGLDSFTHIVLDGFPGATKPRDKTQWLTRLVLPEWTNGTNTILCSPAKAALRTPSSARSFGLAHLWLQVGGRKIQELTRVLQQLSGRCRVKATRTCVGPVTLSTSHSDRLSVDLTSFLSLDHPLVTRRLAKLNKAESRNPAVTIQSDPKFFSARNGIPQEPFAITRGRVGIRVVSLVRPRPHQVKTVAPGVSSGTAAILLP